MRRLRPDRPVGREAGPSSLPFLALSAYRLGGNLGGSLSPSPLLEIGSEDRTHSESGTFAGSTLRCIPVQDRQGYDGIGSGDHDPLVGIGFQCLLGSGCGLLDEAGQGLMYAFQATVTMTINVKRNNVKLPRT